MLKLTLLSPERRLADNIAIQEISLKGSEGEIQILPGHAAMVSGLAVGAFEYRLADGGQVVGILTGGFFEVHDDLLTVMAEHLELRSEIDVDGARRAQKEAEEALKDASLDEHHFKSYQLKLERSLIQQHLAAKQ